MHTCFKPMSNFFLFWLRVFVLLLAIVSLLSCGGSVGGGETDSGQNDADDSVSCGDIVCPDGTECVEERCVAVDPCRDIHCELDEVCVEGDCISTDSDVDRDGYNILEDCDDDNPSIFPGTSEVCTTGCGEGERTCQSDGSWSDCIHEVNPCELAHAASVCVEDACVISACADGWANCDDSHVNGCETEGQCGTGGTDNDDDGYDVTEDCDDDNREIYPGTTQPCVTGCGDGVITCESNGTWSECQYPTNPCDLPHSTSACAGETCVVSSCDNGWSNCDSSHSNGCETQGTCGGDETTCSDGLDCVLDCSNLICGVMCVADVCPAGASAASELVQCADDSCDPTCDVPNAPGCLPCLQSSCSSYYNTCVNTDC